MYIDPTFEKTIVFDKKFSSPEEAIKDPGFQKMQLHEMFKQSGDEDKWRISENGVVRGKNGPEAIYWSGMGHYATNKEKWTDAIDYHNLALQKGLESASTYYGLGYAHHHLGAFYAQHNELQKALNEQEKAISNMNKAIKLIKNEPTYYSVLGHAYYHSKQYENAAMAFENQLKLNPKDGLALFNLGSTYATIANFAMNDEQYERALKSYAKADSILMQINHTHPDTVQNKAINLLKKVREGKLEAENPPQR
jgi:tetratricopeptide (TPR) repeat protein